LEQGRIEVYGNLKIMVTSFDRIDRMAFLKGNTIYVNIKARRYPDRKPKLPTSSLWGGLGQSITIESLDIMFISQPLQVMAQKE